MGLFITRIELHSASEADYETLHAAMQSKGYTRTIASNTGELYKLPPAEYCLNGGFSRSEAFDKARSAAESTRKKYWILCSESLGSIFELDKVTQPVVR